jgi:simple sugar transport system ATP-binding protein
MLAEAMVGRSVAPAQRRAHATGDVVCTLRAATVRGGARPLLDGVDLELRAGEVVAIAGVAGNGQQALAEVLCGQRALDAGTLVLAGRALPPRPRDWVEAGVARIPEDRHAEGTVGDLALWENAVLERYASRTFARAGVLRRTRAREHAASLVERFDVRGTEGGGLETRVRSLSGGNMQKLILGRALAGDPDDAKPPRLIVANQPTWGLDIGAVAYVHQQLLDAAAAGSAVLLISEDLDEIFALADRIAVMHHGRLGEAKPAGEWTLAAIGLAMAGDATPAH